MTKIVSIHAPVKGATPSIFFVMYFRDRFNPRSREGSDRPRVKETIASLVSIHAPVKGATSHRSRCGQSSSVSIHAPVKGATLACIRGMIKKG